MLSPQAVRGATRLKIRDGRVKKTSHFDTTGKSSRRNAAKRLSAARNAKIDRQLKTPGKRSETKNEPEKKAKPATAKPKSADQRAVPSQVGSQLTLPPTGEDKLTLISDENEPERFETSDSDVLDIPGDGDEPSDFSELDSEPVVADLDAVSGLDQKDPEHAAEPTELSRTVDDEPELLNEPEYPSNDESQTESNDESKIQSVVTKSAIRHQVEAPVVGAKKGSGMRLSPISVANRPENADTEGVSAESPLPVPAEPEFVSATDIAPQQDEQEDVLFQNESPVIAVRTRGPRTIVVGKAANYMIDLGNTSSANAKDVVVNIRIPTWAEVTNHRATTGSARMQPDGKGNTVMQWTVGQLKGNGKEKLLLSLIPRSSRPFDLGVSWTFNPVRSSAQIQVQEPKLELAVMGPQDVQFGETKVYTIIVSNPGTGDAENVVLQLLPLIPSENSGGVRQIGTLKAGTRRTVEVELTARQSGRLQIRAEATADGGLFSRNHQEVIVRRASIAVKIEGPPMKYANTRARYSIHVTNTGDASARDVVAVATLPSGATNIVTNGNGSVHEQHGQVKWDLGMLRPGGIRRMQVDCLLTEAGANRVDLRSVAHGNISAVESVITNVESLADLKLAVNDPQGAVAIGTDVVYEVVITNRGTKEARNINVVGYFSEGIEPALIDGWAGRVVGH